MPETNTPWPASEDTKGTLAGVDDDDDDDDDDGDANAAAGVGAGESSNRSRRFTAPVG